MRSPSRRERNPEPETGDARQAVAESLKGGLGERVPVRAQLHCIGAEGLGGRGAKAGRAIGFCPRALELGRAQMSDGRREKRIPD